MIAGVTESSESALDDLINELDACEGEWLSTKTRAGVTIVPADGRPSACVCSDKWWGVGPLVFDESIRWTLFHQLYAPSGPVVQTISREVLASGCSSLAFVCGLDPLAFWLFWLLSHGGHRERVADCAMRVKYAGVDDELLEVCSVSLKASAARQSLVTIDMSDCERRLWKQLRGADAAWETRLGPRAIELLAAGKKIPTDALFRRSCYSDAGQAAVAQHVIRAIEKE